MIFCCFESFSLSTVVVSVSLHFSLYLSLSQSLFVSVPVCLSVLLAVWLAGLVYFEKQIMTYMTNIKRNHDYCQVQN